MSSLHFALLAQQQSSSGGAIAGLIVGLIELAIVVLFIAGMWKVFVKAGQPGWAAIIPFYNIYVLLVIVGKPIWWLILFLIPVVGLVVGIIVFIDLAKRFGKGAGFGIGLVFLPFNFFPLLGFGDATYQAAPGAHGFPVGQT